MTICLYTCSLSLVQRRVCFLLELLCVFYCMISIYICAAPYDFGEQADHLVFHDAGVMCTNITIVMRDTAEDPESFAVVLTSRDDRAEVKQYYVPVIIVDITGQSHTSDNQY